MGQLEHQPVAVHHVAGLHVRHVTLILNGVAVVSQLVHLPFEVESLVDPHLKGSLLLFGEIEKCIYNMCESNKSHGAVQILLCVNATSLTKGK